MRKRLAVFWNSFLFLQNFWVKNALIDFKNKVLSVVFIKLKCRWLQTCLPELEKQQTIEISLMVDFKRIFKNIAFFNFFRDF